LFRNRFSRNNTDSSKSPLRVVIMIVNHHTIQKSCKSCSKHILAGPLVQMAVLSGGGASRPEHTSRTANYIAHSNARYALRERRCEARQHRLRTAAEGGVVPHGVVELHWSKNADIFVRGLTRNAFLQEALPGIFVVSLVQIVRHLVFCKACRVLLAMKFTNCVEARWGSCCRSGCCRSGRV